jgi:hypothetical protein
MKVYDKPCQNCLFSKDRIVSEKAAKQIIKECIQNETHFICHKATMNGDDICCKTFYDKFGHVSRNIQFAKWLNYVKIIPQSISEKLTPFNKIKTK